MRILYFFFLFIIVLTGCTSKQTGQSGAFIPVPEVRDLVIDRIIREVPASRLDSLDNDFMMNFITPEEKEVFANNHWRFTVDQPVLVSVMRHKEQKIVPFWLIEKGFTNTGKTVRNENYEYEVWQKEYPAGEIRLGINGFDLHRVSYFVTIGPVKNGIQPTISRVYPDEWKVISMEKGAYTYNDWDELVIEELPEELNGHVLFTTIRGRARDAAVLGAFRKTDYPSSVNPDQVVLTWSEDPETTQSIQFRTDTTVGKAWVEYWPEGTSQADVRKQEAQPVRLTDVYIYNDRSVNHWETVVRKLTPGTRYNYKIQTDRPDASSPVYSFRTAPDQAVPFQFIHLGDTHNDDIVKPVIEEAYKTCPDAGFIVHSGDHVNIGLFRNLWDKYFEKGKNVFPFLSLAPTLGNHDSQDGLPPVLYTQLFMLPKDSSCNLPAERNYSFRYSNARLFMIDATGDVDSIACWLEKELKQSKEQWKIAVTHFPPYSTDDSYPDIREKWCSLFDQYHVDLVLSGHIHQYFRSYPIFGGEVASRPDEGTVYISSLVVETREREIPSKKYNPVYANQGGLYQIITIDGNRLNFLSKSKDGRVIDRFERVKSVK